MKLVKPKKFLGQHFLKDLKVAQDIDRKSTRLNSSHRT